MKLIDGLDALDRLDPGGVAADSIEARSAVLVGVFDGVHLGHQRLLHELLELASAHHAMPTVITFRNHPDELLRGRAPEWIVDLPYRLRLLRRAGVKRVVLLSFDAELRSMTAGEFTERLLVRGLRTSALLLGYDAAIGRDREGTPSRMRQLGAQFGFAVREGSILEVDATPVSSTRIRAAIQSGELALAHRMLGRWPSVLGKVVRGAGRGHGLGYPTANLTVADTVMPPAGVYAVEVLHDGLGFAGVANYGARPTFDADAGNAPLEVHIFDFDGELYGAPLEVAFLARIRGQQKFADPSALRAQIASDVARAREITAT